MAGRIFSGTITTGIVLDDPTTERPATITGKVTNAAGADAVYGAPLVAWTVNNQGTIENTGFAGYGIHLTAGGTVNNAAARLISGYGGVLIEGAAGTVSNLGTINETALDGRGAVNLAEGGQVINGSAAVTTARILGGDTAVFIDNAAGTVTNFGAIESLEFDNSAVVLSAGGSVANGSAASTVASIAGALGGIYAKGGFATVTNFGSISGGDGISLRSGGRVTNGQSGSAAGHIAGFSSNAVLISGAAGTVANFGTIQAAGVAPVVHLNAGGTVTNGASGAAAALITGTGTGVYIGGAAGTVTNFGVIEATSTVRGAGVALRAGGAVTNFGTIKNASATNVAVYVEAGGVVTNGAAGSAAALISSPRTGVSASALAVSIVNFGTIEGTAGDGAYLQLGGAVTNQAGATISGSAYGIQFRNGKGTATNLGTIRATGAAGKGVGLLQGGSITNGKSGSTIGSITGTAVGVYLKQLGGSVTNFGTIKGATGFLATGSRNSTLVNWGTVASTSAAGAVAVNMGNSLGNNLLVVEPGAVFTGLVEGGGNGTIELVPSGTANMTGVSGFAKVVLANGVAHSLTLTNAAFAGVSGARITVTGGNAGNTVSAATVTGRNVTMVGGLGKDVFTGGAGRDIFVFTATTLSATDVVKGGAGTDRLQMTTAGTVAAAGVSGVEIYQLANGGANTLKPVLANFSGVDGSRITVYGGSGGNTVDASAGGLTAADRLVVYGGAGVDVLKGGPGNDVFVFTAAALAATDIVDGGAGKDELLLTTVGTIHAAGVKGVETYVLADGGANTLVLASSNFTGLAAGAPITIADGDKGNTINASPLTAAEHIVVYVGAGGDTLTGGDGADEFAFSAPGNNTITNFLISGADKIALSNAGFALGQSGATSTPKPLPAALFTQNATGAFSAPTQRFAYDTTNGDLFYSATGTTATEKLVVSLTGTPDPAGHLFFIA